MPRTVSGGSSLFIGFVGETDRYKRILQGFGNEKLQAARPCLFPPLPSPLSASRFPLPASRFPLRIEHRPKFGIAHPSAEREHQIYSCLLRSTRSAKDGAHFLEPPATTRVSVG